MKRQTNIMTDNLTQNPVVTDNEIASVVAILRRLQPTELKDRHELIQEGTRLFERTIKTKLFGEDSVVVGISFFKPLNLNQSLYSFFAHPPTHPL